MPAYSSITPELSQAIPAESLNAKVSSFLLSGPTLDNCGSPEPGLFAILVSYYTGTFSAWDSEQLAAEYIAALKV